MIDTAYVITIFNIIFIVLLTVHFTKRHTVLQLYTSLLIINYILYYINGFLA
jgi:hypothetical protein